MLFRRLPLYAATLTLAACPAAAAEIVACVVAPIPNNPAYYGTSTTITQLKCEFGNKDYYPTIAQLYQQGWRLIEVVQVPGAERGLASGAQAASPLYFFEREKAPVETPTPPAKKPETKK